MTAHDSIAIARLPGAFALSRRRFLGTLGAGVSLAALPGCRALGGTPDQAGAEALLDEIAWTYIEHSPTTATGLGIDTGDKAYLRGQLSDASPAGQDALAASLREELAKVRTLDRDGLAPATRTSLDVVESCYATALDGFALPYGDVAVGSWRNAPYVVIQNVGAYLDYPRFISTDQPVENAADAEAYLARLAAIPRVLDGELERMRAATDMGVLPPDFLLAKAIPQMEASITDCTASGAYVSGLASKTAEIPGAWQQRAEAIVTGQIAPALTRQLEELKRQAGLAGSDAGMWARPQGEEWYRWALRASTTTSRSPEEIHELGRETLATIHARMDQLLRPLGYTEGGAGERMLELAKDPRFQFAEGDEGRAQIMDFVQQRIDWIRAQMPRAFERLVEAEVEVRRLPPAEEPGAPTAYGGSGSIDGTIPPRMWINLRTTDLHRRYDLPTLVHHETIPGHAWEGTYSNQLPLIRSILAFNAFSEGWALYAEQLALELGAYDGNPAWELGYLQDQAYRAVRLVVDTGMHAKRWTRQQAIDFFRKEVGKGVEETTNEIDRYCSWPGQACGYMVGKLEILAQRERAMAALGEAYDLRGFNQAVVEGGNAPLDVLAKNVERYIESAKG